MCGTNVSRIQSIRWQHAGLRVLPETFDYLLVLSHSAGSETTPCTDLREPGRGVTSCQSVRITFATKGIDQSEC